MSAFSPSVKLLNIAVLVLDDVAYLNTSIAKLLGNRMVTLPSLDGFDKLHFHRMR